MKVSIRRSVNLSALILALAFLVPGVGLAQVAPGGPTGGVDQSLKGVELKGKVPVNRSVLKINLPQPHSPEMNGIV